MDAYATAGCCRQSPCAGVAGTYPRSPSQPKIPLSVRCNPVVSLFADEGHLWYYSAGGRRIRCGVKSETLRSDVKVKDKETSKLMKKRLKLLKNLSRDLFTMTQIGFGFDCADGCDLPDREREKAISGAAEALLAQLQELKTKVKDEKCRDSSSSSSSESSDSDCKGSINMNRTKHKPGLLPDLQPLFNQESLYSLSKPAIDEGTISFKNPDSQPLFNQESVYSLSKPVIDESTGPELGIQARKIEVCMGGKCKKSGAQAILEELQSAVGIEGAVCGSKCMGKCKVGPNVRLSSATDDLCIGVGVQDVSLIASGFLRGKGKELVAS
ncbi:unnamed protein product [Cuscuta campestris]|uniref:Diacylglycerol O-acyltransferase 3, cytosolic n=1 Tax=Cuscuta campestris TaxID=132261 RepID=A0A484LDH4_9ASTE|nr:unnamed protein product [Cuscuta campestris]